jgi:hypothetical protein
VTRRDSTLYADMGRAFARLHSGASVGSPVAGFYRTRLRGGGVIGGVRLWHGPPLDPVTGEELDRSHRWQAEFDGDPVDFDEVWPKCAGSPITEAEYRALVARREWSRKFAPGSAHADPRKRLDPLDPNSPLPF